MPTNKIDLLQGTLDMGQETTGGRGIEMEADVGRDSADQVAGASGSLRGMTWVSERRKKESDLARELQTIGGGT